MSLTAILIAIFVFAVIVVYALRPLVEASYSNQRRGLRGTTRQNQALETLLAEKRRVLRAIRDLDFDYDLGKLTDDAYASQRINLIHLGIAILKRVDVLEDEIGAQDARIEEALAAFRQAHEV